MKYFLLLIGSLSCVYTMAQNFQMDQFTYMKESIQFINDGNGRPLKTTKAYEIDGTPFLSNEYQLASLKMIHGKTYRNLFLKLNLHTNEVVFQDPQGKEMVVALPIERIELEGTPKNRIFRTGFPPIDRQNEQSFYEVLDSGNVLLLKYVSVTFNDQQPYSSAILIRHFEQQPVYYAWLPNKGLVKVPKSSDALAAIFNEKSGLVRQYISQSPAKWKKEADLQQLFTYVNSLDKHQ